MSGVVTSQPPDWLTPETAERMALDIVMCCKEAGYPDTYAERVVEQPLNWWFVNVPHDVADKAGALVRQRWGIDSSD